MPIFIQSYKKFLSIGRELPQHILEYDILQNTWNILKDAELDNDWYDEIAAVITSIHENEFRSEI